MCRTLPAQTETVTEGSGLSLPLLTPPCPIPVGSHQHNPSEWPARWEAASAVFSRFSGPQMWAQKRADSPRPGADGPESHLPNTLSPSIPDSIEGSEHISTYTHACIHATLTPYPRENSVPQKYNACKPHTPSPFPSKYRTTAKESRVGTRPAHLPSSVMPRELSEPRTSAGGAGCQRPLPPSARVPG